MKKKKICRNSDGFSMELPHQGLPKKRRKVLLPPKQNIALILQSSTMTVVFLS